MVRELMQDLKTYFNNIKNPSERERQLLKQLNAGYFVITSVHRNDLARTGFDVEKISDNDMDKQTKIERTNTKTLWKDLNLKTVRSSRWHRNWKTP